MPVIPRHVSTLRRAYAAKLSVWRLSRQTDPKARLLADAIQRAAAFDCSEEERGWIDRIENVRVRLLESEAEISLTDYGAGSADGNLSVAEMEAGVAVQRRVKDCCRASKSPKWAFLLFRLVRALHPEHCIELGACVGISAAYQAAALEINGRGTLTTLEGASSLAAVAEATIREVGSSRCEVIVGRFQNTLSTVLARNAPVDYAFIDGHHDESATLGYFLQMRPHCADGALIVFDDIAWSEGMRRAWSEIQRDAHVRVAVDLGSIGLCTVSQSPRSLKSKVALRLRF